MMLSLLGAFKHRSVIILKADLFSLPQTLHFRLPCSECSKKPVQPNVLGAVVAVKVCVVNVVIIVPGAWEDKSPVSKPSSKATVHHEGNKDDWVDAEGDGEEASREEDGVLDRVEARAREGGRVVALVVELVDVLVKEATRIRSWQPVDPPGVEKTMAEVVMGLPQVGHEKYPHQMGEGSLSKRSSNRDLMICSSPAVRRLKQGGTNHPD